MKKVNVEFDITKPSKPYISGNMKVYALGSNDTKWFVAWGQRDALNKQIAPVDSESNDSGVKWFSEKREAEKFMRSRVKDIYLPLMRAAGYKEARDCFFRRFIKPEFYPVHEPEVQELMNEALRLNETPATVSAIDVYNESAVYGFGTLEGSVGPWLAEGDFEESLALAESLANKIKEIELQIEDLKARWPAHSVQPYFIELLEQLEEQLEELKGVKELKKLRVLAEKKNLKKKEKKI